MTVYSVPACDTQFNFQMHETPMMEFYNGEGKHEQGVSGDDGLRADILFHGNLNHVTDIPMYI